MNSIGQMWRAFDLMVERTLEREVHGGLLKDKQFIQGFIAESYMDLQSARLMTINAAEKVAAATLTRAPRSRRSRSSCPPRTTASSTAPFRSGAAPG